MKINKDFIIKSNYKDENVIDAFIYHDYLVNVFIDDPGQQYYFKIIIAKDVNNPFAHVEENGCGSYTFDYIGEIKDYIDFHILHKDSFNYDNSKEEIFRGEGIDEREKT